jgi:hypothetical protein
MYDGNGKIINWSQVWPEVKELATIVVNCHFDNLSPAQLYQNHPSFQSFVYRPLASALTNIRKKHNKEVANQAANDASRAVCEYHH